MTCLQIVQCLQLFNIVSSRGPQPTCTSKPPRHSCDPCLIAIASRPTTQIKVHTASQIREAGSWEIPICAAHSCPKCASTGSHHDQSVAHSCNLGAHSFPSALPISLFTLPVSIPALILALILAYLAHILAWSTNIGRQVWLGISKGRVIKEFSEDLKR